MTSKSSEIWSANPKFVLPLKAPRLLTSRSGINETYRVEEETRQLTTFVDVQVWGPSAENFAKLVRKGQEVFIEGPLRKDRWEDKQTGQNRSKLFLKAERWQFTQYRRPEESNATSSEESSAETKKTSGKKNK